METQKTGRGSFAIVFGSAARFLGGDTARMPKDVDVVVSSWGGLQPPSLDDIRQALPQELQGLPIDLHRADTAGFPLQRRKTEHASYVEVTQDVVGVEAPHIKGAPKVAARLLSVEDGCFLEISHRTYTGRDGLAAAIRMAEWADDPMQALVDGWDDFLQYSPREILIEESSDEGVENSYIASGISALRRAIAHVQPNIWDHCTEAHWGYRYVQDIVATPPGPRACELMRMFTGSAPGATVRPHLQGEGFSGKYLGQGAYEPRAVPACLLQNEESCQKILHAYRSLIATTGEAQREARSDVGEAWRSNGAVMG